jgi:hypothetical protein
MWRPVGERVRVLREMEGLGVEVVMERLWEVVSGQT